MWKYLDSSGRAALPYNWRDAFWKMVRVSLVLASLVSVWLLIQRHQNVVDSAIGQHWDSVGKISNPSTAPGTQLDVVYLRGSSSVGPEAIRVTTPWENFRLADLSQLKGLMRIVDAAAALRLVQLRTAFEYDNCWQSTILEVSCIEQEPGYQRPLNSRNPDTLSNTYRVDSGLNAVLSPEVYRLGGFQAPIIVKVPDGYQVTRWVCLFDRLEGTQVQKWQETVSPDGEYHLKVLLSKPVPNLPGTRWGMIGRA